MLAQYSTTTPIMFAILLVSLAAACVAAPSPRFGHHEHQNHGSFSAEPPSFHPPSQLDPSFAPRRRHYDPFADDIFDTRQFWAEMENELRQLDDILNQFYKKFPSVSSSQGIQGNQYKITIPLNGFDEKDIVVKAREGLVMVQAVHKMQGVIGERTYMDIKTLPSSVNVTGSWTYENNVLKITFPLKLEAETEEVTELVVTEGPALESHSREEISPRNDDEGDADVGAHGDIDNRELFTNEIPRNSVEATTYAVDLKGEVEFVPVRYR